MSLTTNFLGLNLKNPIIVAAGPWSRDAASIQKSIDAGAGAVITETITLETGTNIRPRLYKKDKQLYNVMLYSTLVLEQWEYEFKEIDKKDSYLICSIWGSSPSEMSYIGSKVERMGADAIEISISAPIGTKSERLTHYPNYIGEFVKAVVDAVNIPVMVKLSYNSSLYSDIVHFIEKAGAMAITAIDSLKALQGVDINLQKSIMPTYGGLTGEHLRPVALATVATLAQSSNCQLSGVGGIFNYEHVLEYIMLGSTTVQMASALLLGGPSIITDTINDLEKWMVDNKHTSIRKLRGSALRSLAAYEDIPVKNYISKIKKDYNCENYQKCIDACIYDAIIMDNGKLEIINELCTGCGLCVQLCPNCFELTWD